MGRRWCAALLTTLVVGAGCGSSSRTLDDAAITDPNASPPAGPALTTEPSTTTTVPDRSLGGPADWINCNLGQILINTSHLLDVDAGEPRIIDTILSFSDVVDADGQMPTTPIDTVDVRVWNVRFVRPDDPRTQHFPTLGEGTELNLSHLLPGSPFRDIADSSATLAIGQLMHDTVQEWAVYAAMHVAGDGTIAFTGPCADQYAVQLAQIATAFGAIPDLEFFQQQIAEALTPGRSTDVDYWSRPPEQRGVGVDSSSGAGGGLPPSLAGHLRVVGLLLDPVGTDNPMITLRSAVGTTNGAAAQAASGAPVLIAAVVVEDSPVDVVLDNGLGPIVVATIDAAAMQGADGVYAIVDVDHQTATAEPVSLEYLAAHTTYALAELQSLQVKYQSQLTASTSVPEVNFWESAPVSS